ncbi:MAG: enoyl-CoA hydratase-related protein [Alphaproteobacteria bacterium]|nr:enoyl-CoA hydratase-related protein [Alphaproteobacteria bacterium]
MKLFINITIEIDALHRGFITLDRPEKHNAFNELLIQELTDALDYFGTINDLRCLVLKANGKSFCAGADLDWMKRMAVLDQDANYQDAFKLATLLEKLNAFPRPTIAIVQGPAYGGGVGLIACCDIVIAHEKTNFTLSEVKLGLVASTIAPYIINAIGQRHARRYLLSAELFSAKDALDMGLVHQTWNDLDFQEKTDKMLAQILNGDPIAQQISKKLIFDLGTTISIDTLKQETSKIIAERRASNEGKEGLNAFFEKRQPAWTKEFAKK